MASNLYLPVFVSNAASISTRKTCDWTQVWIAVDSEPWVFRSCVMMPKRIKLDGFAVSVNHSLYVSTDSNCSKHILVTVCLRRSAEHEHGESPHRSLEGRSSPTRTDPHDLHLCAWDVGGEWALAAIFVRWRLDIAVFLSLRRFRSFHDRPLDHNAHLLLSTRMMTNLTTKGRASYCWP